MSTLILLNAGYDLEGYEAYMYSLYQKYPVISMNGIYDQLDNFYEDDKEISDDLMEGYKYLQYYRMNTECILN